ncbi:MAG: hypothetical protein QM270_09810, partial [Bacillota bacterium]|nr:hypothetical protein [Bacillota bacterium]
RNRSFLLKLLMVELVSAASKLLLIHPQKTTIQGLTLYSWSQNSTLDTIEEDWKSWVDSMMPKVQLVLDDLNSLDYIPQSYEDQLAHIEAGTWLP